MIGVIPDLPGLVLARGQTSKAQSLVPKAIAYNNAVLASPLLGSSVTVVQMGSRVQRSESDLLVFISSRMDAELAPAREIAMQTIDGIDFGRAWAFESTPASSETASDAYLRNVEDADFVVWLVGSTTTRPVGQEINRCLATRGRLLVFKLPAEQRDTLTEGLLQVVSEVVKWREVASLSELGAEIRSAVLDEFIKGFRDPTGPARNRFLQDTRNQSLAHCEVSWRSAGADDALAKELAHDTGVGDVLGDLPPGLNVVVGPQGSGKTLASHRLFQNAATAAIEDSSKPFPVFIEAADLQGSFWEVIGRRCAGYVDPHVQPITVFVDGLDERGISEANSLLQQLETYLVASPNTIVVAGIRPLPGLRLSANVIEMPAMGDRETEALVQRVSGKDLPEILPLLGEESLRQSTKSPLFAVMLGAFLRDNDEIGSISTYRLVEHMAANALNETSQDAAATDALLQMLAVKVVTMGTRVRPREVTPRQAEQRLLADSRLVFESENGFDFTLPIFREWYAARAILERAVMVQDMNLTSDRWAIPLSIVVHSEDRATARNVMERVASTNPAIAGELLEDDELNQSQGEIRIWRKSAAADHLQVQVEELHRARLSQSSSPRKCRFHLGFSLGGAIRRPGRQPTGGDQLRRGEAPGAVPAGRQAAPAGPGAVSLRAAGAGERHLRRGGRHEQ